MAATSSLVTSLALAIAGVNALPTTIIPQTIIVARTIVLETDIFNILYGFMIFLSLNFVKAFDIGLCWNNDRRSETCSKNAALSRISPALTFFFETV